MDHPRWHVGISVMGRWWEGFNPCSNGSSSLAAALIIVALLHIDVSILVLMDHPRWPLEDCRQRHIAIAFQSLF